MRRRALLTALVHHILRSDRDRAMHDHPWENASLVLRGGYWEVAPGAAVIHTAPR